MKLVSAVLILFLASSAAAAPLVLHPLRGSPYDLAILGCSSGSPDGAAAFASWEDLRALPASRVQASGEFVPGKQALTAVFLDDLWRALPVPAGADALVATCDDGYAAVFTLDFIARYRPFLVMEIEGKGPRAWPPPGLAFDPGPYVITVSADVAPESAHFLDIEHKKPWAVTGIEFVNFAGRQRGFYSGKWASLAPAAAAGREIWINSCGSCHQGPAGTIGGNKAHRPFEVIAAYAEYDRPFFVKYVRNPKSLVASAKMEAHPHYTDEQLNDLAEFITRVWR
jgi:cytochrome c2